MKPNPQAIRELILQLWLAGSTGGEIAAAVGKSRCAVMGIVNRAQTNGEISGAREARAPVEKKTPPPPPPPPPPPEHGASPLTIYELRRTSCRWPVSGDSRDGSLRYCGARAVGEEPYCEEHAAKARTKPYTGPKVVIKRTASGNLTVRLPSK